MSELQTTLLTEERAIVFFGDPTSLIGKIKTALQSDKKNKIDFKLRETTVTINDVPHEGVRITVYSEDGHVPPMNTQTKAYLMFTYGRISK